MFGRQKPSNHEFLQFCGYMAAHFIWQTEDGGNIVPLLAFRKDKQDKIERFTAKDYATAMSNAEQRFTEVVQDAEYAVLIYDGFMKVGVEKMQAAIIRGISTTDNEIQLAIPYLSKLDPGGPKVYKPKLSGVKNVDIQNDFGQFFEGAQSHEKAWAYWSQNMDESR